MKEQKSIHENINHGTVDFPYAIYHVRIPIHFTSYPLHWHKELELIYVFEGALTVTVNGKKIDMKKGDIAVILPEQPHAMFQYENEQANYINIVFDLEFLKSNGAASYLYNKYIAPFVKGDRTINPYIPQSSAMNQQIRSYVQELFESRYESYTNDELPNPAVKPQALAMGI